MMDIRILANWARRAALLSGLSCVAAAMAEAQTLSVSGSPTPMVINTAIAGQLPTDASDLATTFSVRAQNRNNPAKITARLNAPMPAGMTLTIQMQLPTGATGGGPIALDATEREIIGNITTTNNAARTITYTLSATPAAGVVPIQSRTVTFTVSAWP
jgi:hypothetical protein